MFATEQAEEQLITRLAEARAYERKGAVLDAELIYKQLLHTAEAMFGLNSKPVAAVLFDLGALYATQDKLVSARECFERAQQILRW